MTLRPYQATAVESALRALATSGSAVLQMPTGAGKTKAATAIIERASKPVWFICHRQEIERQAAAAFSKAGIDFGIVSPRAMPEYGKPVQIVSVATLARRIAELPLPALVIWDECHHVAAKSWAALREKMGDAQQLGLTATPERLDGKGLSEWFNELIVGPSTRELIDDGWLSDFRYFAPSEPDLTGARIRAGDYRKEDAAKAMNTPVLIGDAIAEYQKNAAGKRALVFAASVESSKALVERFNAEGIRAAHVDGTTPTEARDAAVAALASGGIKVLSNVEVFTEGFDLPAIDAVVLMRPTKSLALFLQMVGRALRKAEGKDEALIFDHAGLWLDHDWFDLPISWSLEGGARRRRLAGRTVGPRRCPECKEVRPVREPTCPCGYEFPTGREIGECDGVLRELRGAVPEGCVTKSELARCAGVQDGYVRGWIKAGLPVLDGGFIPKDAGLRWVEANTHHMLPDGFETVTKFAERVGASPAAVGRWARCLGLPSLKRGQLRIVNIEEAMWWVSKNKPRPEKIEASISQAEFADIVGVSKKTISGWANRRNSRIGRLPTYYDGTIPVMSGKQWVEKHLQNGQYLRMHPPIIPNSHEYESVASFAKRVGVHRDTPRSWAKRGLPCAPNGWVHIQRGLEWVRDNTSIKIPPEAWPSANDNDSGTPTKRAA